MLAAVLPALVYQPGRNRRCSPRQTDFDRDDGALLRMNLELVKAIVVLPGTALVYVPGAILRLVTESGLGLVPARLAQPRFWLGLVHGASGFALAVWTVSLFRFVGEGTPAPWAPPRNLVVQGPYRHVRNPMITSVLVMLAPNRTAGRAIVRQCARKSHRVVSW